MFSILFLWFVCSYVFVCTVIHVYEGGHVCMEVTEQPQLSFLKFSSPEFGDRVFPDLVLV